MERILICKICKKEVKVNKYKIENPADYTCARCRGIGEDLIVSARIKVKKTREEILA